MKTRNIIIILFLTASTLFADNYTKNDIKHQIISVENKLKEIKTDGAAAYAQKEILQIEDLVHIAKKYLADDKLDLAYYEINVATKFFDKIKAIKQLDKEKNKYDELQKKITLEKNKNDKSN